MPLQADINMDDSSFRRRSHRESNGGHSGYVPVDDEYLQHSGVRGKRGCCLCTLLVILLLVAVINALVSDHLLHILEQPFPGLLIRLCTRKLFFLSLIQNICCGYSKELSR